MKYFSSATSYDKSLPAAKPGFEPAITSATAFTLSDEQQAVLDEVTKGSSVVVDSVIGSGKTSTIQAIVNAFPYKRILYLTYNKLLKLDAQKKIQNRNATVQNYHGFVYKYLTRRGINVPPDKQIKTFLEKCSDIPLVYDLIMVDEMQDLEEDSAQLLLHLAKECPNAQWVFVGDLAQKIYDKTKIDVYKDCIEKIIPDYVPLYLTKSFRISKQHADMLSQMWEKEIKGVNEDCLVEETTDFADLLYILDNTPNKDALVLGPRYGLTQELVNLLERHDPKKYNKQTVWTSIRDKDENFKVQPDSLIVTTYDGCKGMERPVCIVIDWTNQHFASRVEKPFVKQDIIRNLFCVAASRGKSHIIFYRDPFYKAAHSLCLDDLALSYSQILPEYQPSTMFSFKHPVDVLRCMDDLTIQDIPQKDTSVIDVLKADGNIDLTPAIGVYQEITFFKNYNFQQKLDRLSENPILSRIKNWIAKKGKLTDQEKALALTAYETELFRYCQQANPNFIEPEMHDRLITRLSSKLNPNSKQVQVPCHIVDEFTATGYIDYVDKSGIPWELKFVQALSNENYLQAAMYCVSKKKPYAYLWNVRSNQLKKVSVKDTRKFLDDVYVCITMGRKLRRE